MSVPAVPAGDWLETCCRCLREGDIFEGGWIVDPLHGSPLKQPEPGSLAEFWWVCPGCVSEADVEARRLREVEFWVPTVSADEAEGVEFLRQEGLDEETIAAIREEQRRRGYSSEGE